MLDFGMSPEDAVLAPRLGDYAFTLVTANGKTTFTLDPTTHLLDQRISGDIVCSLLSRGVGVSQKEPTGYSPGVIDTGFPTLVTIDAAMGPERLKGMTPEWVVGVAAGY